MHGTAKAGLLLALVFALDAAPAPAQTRAEINEKIEALQKQLRAVQRRVFDQESPYFEQEPAGEGAASAPAAESGAARNGGGSTLLADLTVRMEQLSSQLSELTGQIEELRHENRQLKKRLERFETDVNQRLSALEDGRAAAGPDTAGPDPVPVPHIAAGGDAAAASESDPALAEAVTSGTDETGEDGAADASETASVEEQYERAYSLLRRGRMEDAEAAFQGFVERNGDHDLAANAQYWLGETFYVRENYPRAAQAFLSAYQDYPDSNKAADSLLKLGMTLAALDKLEDACATFDELDSAFPDAEERITRRMRQERERLDCG